MGSALRQARLALVRLRTATQRFLSRRRWLYWALVAATATLTIAAVEQRTATIDRARAEWGETRSVVIATDPIGAGETLTGRTTAVELPVAMLPVEPVTRLDPDAIARRDIATRAVLTADDLQVRDGPLAITPDGWVIAAIVESPSSGAGLGDAVLVASEGLIIAPDAVVVGTTTEATLVALPVDTAAVVAHAVQTGNIALLVAATPIDQ